MRSTRLCAATLVVITCGISLVQPGQAATYEFRATPTGPVIGQIEFAEPPARPDGEWTSTDSGDLLALFLDDTLFGLGSGNVLDLFDDFLQYDVASIGGGELDFALGIQDDTPGGAAGGVSDFVQLGFGTAPDRDVVESFANAAFVTGDWVLAETVIPLPAAFSLFASAVGLLGWIKRRAV